MVQHSLLHKLYCDAPLLLSEGYFTHTRTLNLYNLRNLGYYYYQATLSVYHELT